MRVLIAEDSATERLILQLAIEQLGHTCLLTEDGEAAWAEYRTQRPDVIVSDWRMPGLEGPELCRRVRSQPGPGYTYFILLTGLDDTAHAQYGMQAGADDYLTKPLNLQALQLRLIAAERVTDLHRRLAERDVQLRQLAETDALTGLANRHKATEQLESLLRLAGRQHACLGLGLLDLDRFKQVNDTRGHQAGDQVLRAFGHRLQQFFRTEDVVARWGGEEFLIGLYGTRKEDTARRLEALLRALQAEPALGALAPGLPVSFSAGVAEFPGDGSSLAALCQRADQALYQAKALGRAQVQCVGAADMLAVR